MVTKNYYKYLMLLVLAAFCFTTAQAQSFGNRAEFPMEEDWSSESFNTHDWGFDPSQGNWKIVDFDGNPEPCAIFSWDPGQTNYSFSLVSDTFAIPADAMNVTLKYDMRLFNLFNTGEEHLAVDFYDGSTWHTLADYDNGEEGDIPWDTYLHDVTDYAAGNTVKFRFRAYGADTWNIWHWAIDNVKFYEQVQYEIYGTVTELATGNPIEGAEIKAETFDPVYTDANGNYSLFVDEGTWDVYCYKQGYTKITQEDWLIDEDVEWNPELTAPTMEVDQQAIEVTVQPGGTATAQLTISNNGNAPLYWDVFFTYDNENIAANYPKYADVLKGKNLEYTHAETSDGKSDLKMLNKPVGEIITKSGLLGTGFGYMIHDPQDSLPVSPCYFPLDDPQDMQFYGGSASNLFATADYIEGTWYGLVYDDYEPIGELITVNTSTGEIEVVAPARYGSGMAYDITTGNTYMVTFGGKLYTIDLETGEDTFIANTRDHLISIVCTNDGKLYGVDIEQNTFGTLDKETGDWTVLWDLSFDPSFAQDLAIDRSTNTIYWAAYDAGIGQGQLMTVDLDNQSANLIGTFIHGAEIIGFAIPGGAPEVWTNILPRDGEVAPGESMTIDLEFEAGEFEAGDTLTGIMNLRPHPNVGVVPIDLTMYVQEGTQSQEIELTEGYQFVSSRIIPPEPDMLEVCQNLLGPDLDFVRNSEGQILQKVGDNWVNGIGEWVTEEGYLFKMFAGQSLTIEGEVMDPQTPINLETGYQFVSYLKANEMDALMAFESILNDNLDFIRNSQGQSIQKIGNDWVNGIGNCIPTHGYLVRMLNSDELVYPEGESTKMAVPQETTFFEFKGGNPADPVYTVYIKTNGIVEPGDEIAAFDKETMVGAAVIESENALKNDIPIFATLNQTQGYKAGNELALKVYDKSENELREANFELINPHGDAVVSGVFPSADGAYSIAKIKNATSDFASGILEIYPNPATDKVIIGSKVVVEEIRITGVTGELMYQATKFDAQQSIDVKHWSPGIYVVAANTGSGMIYRKMIIK